MADASMHMAMEPTGELQNPQGIKSTHTIRGANDDRQQEAEDLM
jgi:hypothetical protein